MTSILTRNGDLRQSLWRQERRQREGMKVRRRYLLFGVVAIVLIGLAVKAFFVFQWNETKGPTEGPVHLLATIAIPGEPLSVFDVGWVDPQSRRFFLADQSNAGV